MIRQALIAILIVFVNSGFASESNSTWKEVDAKFSTGIKSGHITFKIGGLISDGESIGKAHFPISELKFPKNYKTAQFAITMKGHNNWDVLFEIETNLSKDAGLLEDSDWLSPDRLDIYSDSKTEISAKEFLFEVSNDSEAIRFLNDLELCENRFGFGLIGQFLDYRAYDTVQSYPSSNEPDISLKGDTILYDFVQITPFVSYSISHSFFRKAVISGKIIVSPFMFLKDKDYHILREKTSKSSTRGWLFDSSIVLNWNANPSLSLFTAFNYQQFEANGNQTQKLASNYESRKLKVKVKHIGQQMNIKTGIIFRF